MASIADLTDAISPGFTESVLQDILRKKSGFTNVTAREIILGSASKKGDSYLSTVCRFTVKASGINGAGDNDDFEVHVIVKSVPNSLARAKSFRSLDFFGTEIDFYDKVWSVLDAFQKRKNLPQLYDSIPLCLATYSDGKYDFIALEDLSYQGYTGLARDSSGLDLGTTLFILRNFAKFHGISVAYKAENPDEFEEMDKTLQETYFDEKYREWYEGTMAKFIEVVKDAAKQELPPSYLKKIEEVSSQDLFGNICKLLKTRTTLCSVTHGDCWPPNFLVQENDNIRKLALIDFQLMRWTSLTTDVLFLLYTCVDPLVRNEHWEFLLQQYYKAFTQTLKDLDCKLNVTFNTLKEEVKMFGLFAFGMCNEALIMSLTEDEDVADLESIQGDEPTPLHEIWNIVPIKSKEKRKRVADYLKHLIDNGLI